MKSLIIKICCLLTLFTGIIACQSKIDDNYTDPEKTTSGDIGKLFTYMLYNDRVRPTYWDYATFVTGVTGKYSQLLGIVTGNKMYEPSTGYNQDRWNSYYTSGIMNQYREIQKNYNKLTDDQKKEQLIFVQLAKIVLDDQTAQMVDLWGDIPFTEAGQLNATNTLINGKFDDAATIYNTLISDLKDINTFLSTATLTTAVRQSLTTQDILLKGDLTSWRRYANSLRLRLLMRISNVIENTAKTEITAMLNNTSDYPMVENIAEDILLNMNPTAFSSEGMRDGLTDGATSSGPIAPTYMLETVMVTNNDPRIPVFWDPGTNGYVGLSTTLTSSQQENLIANRQVATIDTATFIQNYNVPGVLFTAAEVSFLKAEAYERWGLGTAQTAYETGIRQSIEFYYNLNQSAIFVGFSRKPLSTPSDSTVNAFIAGTGIAYTGTPTEKLHKIWTQKWLNFFILQAGQAWAEVRRTDYPLLPFAIDASISNAQQPPHRLLYPDTEKSYNTANYSKVQSHDTRDYKIFWDLN
ncbi:MAG: SusD/RagB family nutrient-binding outer membrane lipoprotein [Bacteroidota bacterium]|nr:SusD/RagB family nutrient-binding outer membrane lipoprotein [Bacteroidota bacterium]